jgi:CheY-like chemotaxis protein
MRQNGDRDEPGTVSAPQSAFPNATDSLTIAAQRARLAAERAACEQTLHKLDADLIALSVAPATMIGDGAALEERLRRLTELDPEFRTQLHIIMGCIQLLRLEHDVTPQLASRLDAMLAAGSRLLEKIHDVNLLSDKDANFSSSRIDAAIRPPGTAHSRHELAVLVADDIEMNRDIAAALLRNAGHHVQTAEDGATAVMMATTLDFDVILMDVRMPGVDGLEATRRIRRLPGLRGEVPIIALTAKVSAEEVAACRAAGMSGHLAKPFRHDTLGETVERAAALRPPPAHLAVPATLKWATNALNPGQLRALISPPAERSAGTAPNAPADSWIDIVSPWSATKTALKRHQNGPDAGATANRPVDVKLLRERQGAPGNLTDPRATCAPPSHLDQSEYHWLLFVEPGTNYPDQFSLECELWRWHRGSWRSVAVPGANFSPDAMYRDGWRYGSACDTATAQVTIIEPAPEPANVTSLWRAAGTGWQKPAQTV